MINARRRRGLFLASFGLALAMILGACQAPATTPSTNSSPAASESQPDAAREHKLRVVTTIYPVYAFARDVAGEDAEVSVLVPPGSEPHGWEPGPAQMVEVSEADLFIRSGLDMDPWAERLAASTGKTDLLMLELSHVVKRIESSHDHSHGDEHDHDEDEHDHDHDHDHDGTETSSSSDAHDHDDHDHDEDEHDHEHDEDEHDHEHEDAHDHGHSHGPFDPHTWLSPLNAIEQVRAIARSLSGLDKANRDAYWERADALIARLEALDQDFRTKLEPYRDRLIVVSHEAYAYLCDAYGLRQSGIEDVLASTEPSPARMAEMVELARHEQITTIYVEPLTSPRNAEALAREIGGQTAILDPFEGVGSDTDPSQGDYFAVMTRNLEALIAGFKEPSARADSAPIAVVPHVKLSASSGWCLT